MPPAGRSPGRSGCLASAGSVAHLLAVAAPEAGRGVSSSRPPTYLQQDCKKVIKAMGARHRAGPAQLDRPSPPNEGRPVSRSFVTYTAAAVALLEESRNGELAGEVGGPRGRGRPSFAARHRHRRTRHAPGSPPQPPTPLPP